MKQKHVTREEFLRDLMDHPGDSYEKISERLGISRQRVGQRMQRLAELGLITVTRGTGRILPGTARLTEQGVSLALAQSYDANGSPVESE